MRTKLTKAAVICLKKEEKVMPPLTLLPFFCVCSALIFSQIAEEHTRHEKKKHEQKIPIFRTGVHYLQKKSGRNNSKRLTSETFALISGK